MRTVVGCAVVMVVGALGSVIAQQRDDARLFNDFIQTYNRQYIGGERVRRFECFKANLDRIDERNALEKYDATHGVNKFTDLCDAEIARKISGLTKVNRDSLKDIPMAEVNANVTCPSIDWRKKGAVGPVWDEDTCGACYAFSTTANIEGILAVAGYPLIPLSNQEIVSCSTGDDGCDGGTLAGAYQWMIDNGGVDSDEDWPWTSGGGYPTPCNKTTAAKKIVAKIGGFVALPQSEASMAEYLCKHGPINVPVNADSWISYTGGVLTTCNGYTPGPDHSVAAVGFDLTANPPYWILKNEWGTDWGEAGYIRIEYGVNMCYISDGAYSATPPKN